MYEAGVRDVATLPLVPQNPLPLRERMKAAREYHVGQVLLRESGGSITRVPLGPKWLAPSIVFVMSPAGARDVLARNHDWCDRTEVHRQVRLVLGDNLAGLPNMPWLPRKRTLQPVFTKQRVRTFGAHMSQAATMVANSWQDDSQIDLDAQARTLTMRVLGRSVLGVNLDQRAESLSEPLSVALKYAADRGMRPVRAPLWLPTRARRRVRHAVATLQQLADDVLELCRRDPSHDSPLVRALIEATDPETGQALSDSDIRADLIAFMIAGHDTSATTLAYALWALGRHPSIQDRVAAEARAIGVHELTPDDLPRLSYTVQVIREALRLCPPVVVAGRTALRDIEVDGYRVEADSMVLVGIFGMQRDPELWPNPTRFDPSRFESGNMSTRDRWSFIPFGSGARSCIGDHFAMLEITLALATIIRDTEIQSLDDDFPLAVPFTMVAASRIPARVKRRKSALKINH